MDPARWDRVSELFEEIADLPGSDREAALAALRAEDPEAAGALERMLVADGSDPSLFGDRSEILGALADAEPGLSEGHRIGPYRILRRIGRGGMGSVYLAEREDAFRMLVAIKRMRVGPVSGSDPSTGAAAPAAREVLERFRRERQILARLQHPRIAHLLDGGADADGCPYLVMEHVDGIPIVAFCDERRLGVEARIRLFLGVLEAVEFAHRNLVVHRDLKPSNVLVTAAGEVKLLDFGIAKVLGPGDDGDDAVTRSAAPLTPEYASPEQLRGETLTTASDVYQLGLLLFELLTGRRPFGGTMVPARRLRAILEGDTPVPSKTVLGTAVGVRRGRLEERTPGEIAVRRSTTPDGLRRRLQGDLDTILLEALRPEPDRRYGSVQAFREDLERHLAGHPVHARGDGAGYRFRKLVGRHPGAFAAAVAAVILTATFGTVYNLRVTAERDRAEREARKAEAVSEFVVSSLSAADPRVSQGESVTVAEMLDSAVVKIDDLASEPELQAELLTLFGRVYRELGRFDEARAFLDRSVAAYDRIDDPDPLVLAEALTEVAMVHFDRREYEEAKEPTRRALAIQRTQLGPDHADVLSSLNNLAVLASNTGDLDEAVRRHEEVLAIRRSSLGPDDPSVGVSLNNLGMVYLSNRRYEEAEPPLREALELRRRILEPNHPDVALALNNLGTAVRELGRLDEAAAMYREALDIRRVVYGDRHPRVAVSLYNLGQLHQRMEDPATAVDYYRRALDIDLETYGPDHLDIAIDSYQLGVALDEAGAPSDALPYLLDAERIFGTAVGDEHRRQVLTRKELGRVLMELGRYAGAEAALRVAYRGAIDGGHDADVVDEVRGLLAEVYRATDRTAEADALASGNR